MSEESRFQSRRRMWAIINGKLQLADRGDTRSHSVWFADEGWTPKIMAPGWVKAFNEIVRGYHLDGDVVAYIGEDFAHWGCYQAVTPMLADFITELDLDPAETTLWVGARLDNHSDALVGHHKAGLISDLVR